MENVLRSTCRLCGSAKLRDIISIGDQYINDFPPSIAEKGRNGRCPLDVIYCEDCSLFQLRHTAPQELLYARHYWYRSGINDKIRADLKEIADLARAETKLQIDEVFLDIGANDGTLLSNLEGQAVRVGCEPASNLQEELKGNTDHMIPDFWTAESYLSLGLPKARVITAIGMFYDMEDPNQFIRDSAAVLAEDGVFIAQLMTLKPMLDKNDVGNICHEHLEFYTYPSLRTLFERNGLEIYRVEENDINGGSYRIFARQLTTGSVDWAENCTPDDVVQFQKRLDESRDKCMAFLEEAKEQGLKVYGYGASTKGNVILQYFGIDSSHLVAIADRNDQKWGSYTLTDIPIVPEDEARAQADVFLVLPYGFIDTFVEREQKWLDGGGRFLVPLPEFRLISGQS